MHLHAHCRQGPKHHHVSDQSRPAFVRNHSQSQAMLTFVNALEVDNWTAPFDVHFVNGREVEAYIASPSPY